MLRCLAAIAVAALLLAGCGPPCACSGGDVCDAATGLCRPGGTGGGGGGSGGGVGGGGGATGGGGGSSCGTDTWTNYASGWFSGNCARCHGSEFGGYSLVQSRGSQLSSRISSGSMPPGGLLPADRQRILSWFACNMPQ